MAKLKCSCSALSKARPYVINLPDDIRSAVSIHEAGHVVAGVVCGMRLENVRTANRTLKIIRTWQTDADMPSIGGAALFRKGYQSPDRNHRHAVVCYAGPLAERVASRGSWSDLLLSGATRDRQMAMSHACAQAIADLGFSTAEAAANIGSVMKLGSEIMSRAERTARLIVAQHFDVIRALARHLDEYGCLDGSQTSKLDRLLGSLLRIDNSLSIFDEVIALAENDVTTALDSVPTLADIQFSAASMGYHWSTAA